MRHSVNAEADHVTCLACWEVKYAYVVSTNLVSVRKSCRLSKLLQKKFSKIQLKVQYNALHNRSDP